MPLLNAALLLLIMLTRSYSFVMKRMECMKSFRTRNPQRQSQTADEITMAAKSGELEASIKGYERELAAATDRDEKSDLRQLIKSRSETLNLLLKAHTPAGTLHLSPLSLSLYLYLSLSYALY